MALSWVCQVNSAVRLSITRASVPHTGSGAASQRRQPDPPRPPGPAIGAAGLDGVDQGGAARSPKAASESAIAWASWGVMPSL